MELTYAEVAERIDSEIQDESLKKLLFNRKHPDEDDISGIGVLYRMMLFTFFYTFAKYKADKKNKKIHNTYPNAQRVFDSFECVYNGEDICFDFIIYVLTEVQIDVITYGKKSYFYGIFSNDENSLQIPQVRVPVKTWIHSAKLAEQDNNKILQWFVGLYESLSILRNVKVIEIPASLDEESEWYKKVKFNFMFTPTEYEFSGFELLFVDKTDNELYYLGSYENLPDNKSALSYYTLGGDNLQRIVVSTSFFLSNSFTTNNNTLPKSIFAKSLFSIGFKYIKNLSYAVCDTITRATKQKLYEHYARQYSDIFELGFNKKWYEVNWDNILTILMFEEGPSEVLELVLDAEGMYFEKILQNLEIRYNKANFAMDVKAEYEVAQSKEMDMVKKYVDDQTSIIKNISAINKTLMAKCIIDGLAKCEENNKIHSNTQFVESLPMRINSITKVTLSNESMLGQTIKINKALEKTFRFIIPFYTGIIAFQKYKDQFINEQEAHGAKYIDRKQLFTRCEEEFFKAAEAKMKEICQMSLGKLIDKEFFDLATSLTSKVGHRITIEPAGRALKSAIGRAYLCSLDTFRKILKIKCGVAYQGENTGAYETTITGFINNVKHDNGSVADSVLLFKQFIQKVKELLYFFIYNEDYEREMIIGQQISYDPIYPYVVRYTEKSENRDGYFINSFSVFFDADNGEKEVKILSDREYSINEKYYCIPNVTMSNSRWWIEPLLIKCRDYDERMAAAVEAARGSRNALSEED